MTIKELRALTGLSQRKFGDLYDIPARSIENWEAGKSQPPEYLIKLLERVVRLDFNVENAEAEEKTKPEIKPSDEKSEKPYEPIAYATDYDYSEYSRDDPPPGLDEFEYIDFLMSKRYEETET